jgi:hypothetical protein
MDQTNIDSNLVANQTKQPIPNAVGTLVLGILSIVMCWCYGVVPLALAIIALAISQKSVQMYNENPELYEGYNNLKAGRIMAIIGLCLGSLFVVFLIIYFIIVGTAVSMGSVFNNF